MNREGASLSECAFDRNVTAVHLSNMLDDCQAKTCAAQFSASAFVNNIKTLKNARKMLRGYSTAVVLHRNGYLIALLLGNDSDTIALRAIFNGIINKVQHSLLK